MARILRILHRTVYRYSGPVNFEPHRLMLRPRDGHDLWVDEAFLRISPRATLRWYFDTFGNSVCEARFSEASDQLLIESELYLRRYARDPLLRPDASRVCPHPFLYSQDDSRDLGPFLGLQNPDDAAALDSWLDTHFPDRPAEAFGLLQGLSDVVHRSLSYSSRDKMGTQTAGETLARGIGTCRDYAFLFMEAARRFGFAARFVTGYLNDSSAGADAPVGGGATHAWADVFVPGEGWIEFDPTNRITAGSELIRVATTRTPRQASPISGSFKRAGGKFLSMKVSVSVNEVVSPPPDLLHDPIGGGGAP